MAVRNSVNLLVRLAEWPLEFEGVGLGAERLRTS